MRRSRLLWIWIILLFPLFAYGQDDSLKITFDQFMEMVRTNHPVYRQADLMLETGDANLRRARGNFDPILKSTFDNKQFDDKNYYSLNNNEIKVPTLLGLEVKAGYEKNTGVFVNPENQLPTNGLAYAGISVPIGKGLFIDERRQVLRQAEIYDRATELERIVILNQLAFDAAKVYWDWYAAWNAYQIYDEAVGLAEFRFQGVRQSFIQGDVPAIDTLEAFIQVQSRQLSRNEALIALRQSMLAVSNFLWSDQMDPLQLEDEAIPLHHEEMTIESPPEDSKMNAIFANLSQSHPQLLLYNNKLEHLDIERRWKAEKLKPKLNVNYNFLNQPVGGNPFEGFTSNNYKWGFEFSMPLLLRQERGDLQITKVKIRETDLAFRQKSLEIQNKIEAYHVELENIFNQIELFRNTVENYEGLLRGERRKFEEGESSLFLVNSRETSLISAEIKLITLLGKYKKAKAGLIQAIGRMEQNI